jgi:aromatic-amino-acid transaminase
LGKSLQEDPFAIRLFAQKGIEMLISTSFAKNFSLYSERVGTLFIVTASEKSGKNVLSKLKQIIRTNYSNPPSHGAKIVTHVLSTESLRVLWHKELEQMLQRLSVMRSALIERLCAKIKTDNFLPLADRQGMFFLSGLKEDQVETLRAEYGIYMTSDGRMNIAGLNWHNVDYVVDAIAGAYA